MKSRSSLFRVSRFILHIIMCYAGILLMLGYSFGSGDHTETLSLLNHAVDPTLYPYDLYIQTITEKVIHERYFFVQLLIPGYSFLEQWAFLLHAFFTMWLIAGMYKVNTLFITGRFYRWIAIIFTLVVLNNYNLGGNELYYNAFLPSLPAKAIGVWSLYYFLRKKFLISALILCLSALFQPLVAAQLLLIHILAFIVQSVFLKSDQNTFNKDVLTALIPVAGLTGYLLWLHTYHTSLTNPEALYVYSDIYLLRSPHHHFPAYFSLKSYIVYGILLAGLFFWSFTRSKPVFIWSVILVTGCIFYSLFLKSGWDFVLQTQWFKTTIWLEMLGVMACLSLVNEKLAMRVNMTLFFFILLAVLIFVLYMRWPPLNDKPYQFEDRWMDNHKIEIASAAKELTPTDALFIIPPDNTTFRYVSRRSVYVDFKSIAHNKTYLQEWAKRIHSVYGLEAGKAGNIGFNAIGPAKEYYTHLSQHVINELQQAGVTHMLTVEDHVLPFEVVARSEDYIIYKLEKSN